MSDLFEKEVEVDEELTEYVAGGVYSEEEWASMSPEERMEAWRVSKVNRSNYEYCQLD